MSWTDDRLLAQSLSPAIAVVPAGLILAGLSGTGHAVPGILRHQRSVGSGELWGQIGSNTVTGAVWLKAGVSSF